MNSKLSSLVHLKYWTLDLRPLMVHPKVLYTFNLGRGCAARCPLLKDSLLFDDSAG